MQSVTHYCSEQCLLNMLKDEVKAEQPIDLNKLKEAAGLK